MKKDVKLALKLPICKIIREHMFDKTIGAIKDVVYRTQIINSNTHDFIRAYFNQLFIDNKNFPKITLSFFLSVCDIVSSKNNSGRPSQSEQKKEIDIFNTNFFSKTNPHLISRKYLSQILNYEGTKYISELETNIKEHFYDHLTKMIKIKIKYKEKYDLINSEKNVDIKNKQKQKLYLEMSNIRTDIFNREKMPTFLSQEKYLDWVKKIRYDMFEHIKEVKKNIFYDIKCDPQKYLKSFYVIANEIEKMNTKEVENKLFNVTPLGSSYVPSHITIDTQILITLLNENNVANDLKNVNNVKEKMWAKHFRMNTNFKKLGCKFTYVMVTDGISCSLLFDKTISIDVPQIGEQYIEDQCSLQKLLNSKINVVVDPNFGNLMEALDDKSKQFFRYTRDQRNQEMGKVKYTKIRETLNKKKVNGKSISEIIAIFSKHNKKSTNIENFKNYLIDKHKWEIILFKHYRKKIFRKMKLNVYTNIQKSESKLIKNFKDKYGDEKKVQIIWGDYDDMNNKTRIKKEPIISKRLRKIFRIHKYKVFLINEFNTSKKCNICECNTQLYKDENGKEKWGLLRCENLNCIVKTKKTGKNCRRIMNRDKNSCMNMLKIVNELKKSGKRPKLFCPQEDTQEIKTSVGIVSGAKKHKPKIVKPIMKSVKKEDDSSEDEKPVKKHKSKIVKSAMKSVKKEDDSSEDEKPVKINKTKTFKKK